MLRNLAGDPFRLLDAGGWIFNPLGAARAVGEPAKPGAGCEILTALSRMHAKGCE